MSQILKDEIDRLHKQLEAKARENRMLLDQLDRVAEHNGKLEDKIRELTSVS